MFRYYSSQRPIVPGSFPARIKPAEIINFDERVYMPSVEKRVWGYFESDEALTAAEIAQYELTPELPYEDKNEICSLLAEAIKRTRGGADLVALEYDADHEMVLATFKGGQRVINVACDSGTAMIRDIMNHLGI